MKHLPAALPGALLLATAMLTVSAFAEVDVYGKANASVQQSERGDESYSELVSNASRLGFTGKEMIDEELTAVYRVEMEYGLDDGDPGASQTLTARNTYLGLEGSFGSALAGKIDTPFKQIQGKIDIFNDMSGDIKAVITHSDNRENNSVHYLTPDDFALFEGKVAYIMSEEDGVANGVSASGLVNLESMNLQLGLAVEKDVEAEDVDVIRLSAQWVFGMFTFGGLWEDQDPGDSALNDGSGWVTSAQMELNPKWRLGLQYGVSDIVEEGGENYGVKLDRILNKNTFLYFFYVVEESDVNIDNTFAGIGMELKF